MINFEYKNILRKKRTKKGSCKGNQSMQKKEKENIRSKQAAKLGPPIDWTTRKTAKKCART